MTTEIAAITTVMLLYAAIVVSPGPNFAPIPRLAISGARQSATGAALGLACAATLYAILSMSDLALLLTRIGWLAAAAQIAGGLFLAYLGVKSWLHRPDPEGTDSIALTQDSFAQGFRLGLVINLSNPKGIAFLISLCAATIPPGISTPPRSLYWEEDLPWKSRGMGWSSGCPLSDRRAQPTGGLVSGSRESWGQLSCFSVSASSSRNAYERQIRPA